MGLAFVLTVAITAAVWLFFDLRAMAKEVANVLLFVLMTLVPFVVIGIIGEMIGFFTILMVILAVSVLVATICKVLNIPYGEEKV